MDLGYDEDMDKLIERLKALKAREGLTYSAIGRALGGVHKMTVVDWMRPHSKDRVPPSTLSRAAIVRLLRRYEGAKKGTPRQAWNCPACAAKRQKVVLDLLADRAAGAPLYSCPECGGTFIELRSRAGVALRRMEPVAS